MKEIKGGIVSHLKMITFIEVYGWLRIFVYWKATLMFLFIVFLDTTISFIVWGIFNPAAIYHIRTTIRFCDIRDNII